MRIGTEIAIVAALVVWHGRDVVGRLRGPPALGPPAAARASPCTAVERVGRGVSCALPEDEASGASAGPARAPPATRVTSASRRLALGLPLSLPRARAADLEALPGIGRALAGRILAARPIDDVSALARVRGVGPRRAAALADPLGLDGRRSCDICSMGSWPTTSSGCDRPR